MNEVALKTSRLRLYDKFAANAIRAPRQGDEFWAVVRAADIVTDCAWYVAPRSEAFKMIERISERLYQRARTLKP